MHIRVLLDFSQHPYSLLEHAEEDGNPLLHYGSCKVCVSGILRLGQPTFHSVSIFCPCSPSLCGQEPESMRWENYTVVDLGLRKSCLTMLHDMQRHSYKQKRR